MRVVFLTNIPSPYRVAFFNMLGKKCELTVLFENKSAKDRNKKWLSEDNHSFKAIFMNGLRVKKAEALCPSVIKYLSKKKFDVVVVGMYSSPTGMLAIEYLKQKKIPFILSTDGGFVKVESKAKRLLKRHFISSASMWLSTGKTVNEYLMHYGAKADKIYIYPFTSVKKDDVLRNILSTEQKKELRLQLGIKENIVILSVGQFIYRKGYDVLLEALHECPSEWGGYIIGGKVPLEYINLKEAFNDRNVHFVDFLKKDELLPYYLASDIFVLPTREDVWGLVVNEAMACGLPVITTSMCVAGQEMIIQGENGYLVSVESAQEIKKAIIKTLDDNTRMSEGALERANDYTIEKMVDAHLNAFMAFVEK